MTKKGREELKQRQSLGVLTVGSVVTETSDFCSFSLIGDIYMLINCV